MNLNIFVYIFIYIYTNMKHSSQITMSIKFLTVCFPTSFIPWKSYNNLLKQIIHWFRPITFWLSSNFNSIWFWSIIKNLKTIWNFFFSIFSYKPCVQSVSKVLTNQNSRHLLRFIYFTFKLSVLKPHFLLNSSVMSPGELISHWFLCQVSNNLTGLSSFQAFETSNRAFII